MADVTYSGEVDALLKKYYTDEKKEVLRNMETKTLSKIKTKKILKGEGPVFLTNYQGNEAGTGAINEDEALKTPGYQKTVQPIVTPKVLEHNFNVSGLSIAMSSGDDAAFAETLIYNTENGMKDLLKRENAMLYRGGDSKLAVVDGGVVSGTTVTIDGGVINHIRPGMPVDFYTGAVLNDSETVVSIDRENSQIELSGNVTVDDDDDIYIAGEKLNAPSDGKEITGFAAIVDDGSTYATYQGISRATVPQWAGITVDASGVNITDDLLRKTLMRGKTEAGKDYKMIFSNTGQLRSYLNTTINQVRYTNGENRDSGIKGSGEIDYYAIFNNTPWYVDTDCNEDAVYFMDGESLFIAETSQGIHWKPQMRKTGYDVDEMVAVHYCNLACTNTKGMLKLSGLNTTTFSY
jgi:hypothetical protein